MGKGLFTQGVVVLLSEAVAIDDIRNCLAGSYKTGKAAAGAQGWEFGGPSFLVEYRQGDNGYVAVDVVGRQWPDHMGDPKAESMLFGAWSMGHFGPYTFPHGLRRATEQAWRWKDASAAVQRHSAFIRIRASYIFGGVNKNAPVMPPSYDPLGELAFVTEIAMQLLRLPPAICYFNPNGEVLLPADELQRALAFDKEHGLPAFDVWCNVRLFNLENDWILMDTVGNWQLDMVDHEAVFPKGQFMPQEVDHFLKNISLYIQQKGPVIADGNTTNGPGNINWRAFSFDSGLSAPPRNVLRWYPDTVKNIPAALLPQNTPSISGKPKAEREQVKKTWWKLW